MPAEPLNETSDLKNMAQDFRMVSCNTSIIIYISCWKNPRPENRKCNSNCCKLDIGLRWDGNLYTATAYSGMGLSQMWRTANGAVGKSTLPGQKANWDRTKMMVDHKRCQKVTRWSTCASRHSRRTLLPMSTSSWMSQPTKQKASYSNVCESSLSVLLYDKKPFVYQFFMNICAGYTSL